MTPRARKARALLACLCIEKRPLDRDRLAALLWSERGDAQAHASLRQSLLELRPFSEGPEPLLAIERHQIAIAGAAELDIDRMAALAARGSAAELVTALGEGEALLEDLEGVDPAFDQWLRAVRAARGDVLIAGAHQACRSAIASGDADAALQLARQLQRIDALDEGAARLAMEAAHALGRNELVQRTYEALCRALREELGVEPAAETRALRDRLVSAPAPRVVRPARAAPPAPGPVPPVPPAPPTAAPKRRRAWAAAAAMLVAAALAALWLWPRGHAVPTVAVTAQQGSEAAMLARQLSLDLARLTGARPDRLSVVDAAAGARPEYLVRVGSERVADRLRADLSLTRRGDSELLWSARFERRAGEAADLQQQMSAKLGSLLLCVGDPRHDAALGDRGARQLLLAACDQLDEPASEQRRALLRQLTVRAPRLAWAWATLAHVEVSLAIPVARRSEGELPVEVSRLLDSARTNIARSRQLDGTLGQAFSAEADLLLFRAGAWAERLAVIERGIAADPDDRVLHGQRAGVLSEVGLSAAAIASARRVVELDPLSPSSRSRLVIMLAYSGNVPGAWRELAAAERIWPGSAALRDARFRLELRFGDPRRALEIIEMDETRGVPGDSSWAGEQAFLRARLDPSPANLSAALRPYEDLRRRTRIVAPSYVQALVQFGRVDDAYGLLGPNADVRAFAWSTDTLFRPHMRAFRNDRRFMPLAARLGLLRYWQARGTWPDFCTDPGLPYDCRAEARRLLDGRS